jgi:anti-sigma-K factor RskA
LNRDGIVVFVGSHLPELAGDRTFELWLIPAKGAPQPLSLFKANAAGGYVSVPRNAVDLSQATALAVSVEPLRGSLAPTTKPILLVPLS